MLKKLLIPILIILVVLGGAFWWFFVRDDAPEELGLSSDDETTQPTGEAPETLDGTWTISPDADSQAGLRITESFAGGAVDHEAVGRSTDVEGSITIDGTQISEGSFTVDLTTLTFSDSPPGLSVTNRANALKNRGLETNTFPDATFELTAPIDFGAAPEQGQVVTAEATGDLTLHGVTNEVTFEVEAKVSGSTIEVATKDPVPIVLADYDIVAPTGGPIASVSDEGSFEFVITLEQG